MHATLAAAPRLGDRGRRCAVQSERRAAEAPGGQSAALVLLDPCACLLGDLLELGGTGGSRALSSASRVASPVGCSAAGLEGDLQHVGGRVGVGAGNSPKEPISKNRSDVTAFTYTDRLRAHNVVVLVVAVRPVNHGSRTGDKQVSTTKADVSSGRLERHMTTAEHSYFNFLMEYRCARRVRIPFAQAVGVMPDLACVARARRPTVHAVCQAGPMTLRDLSPLISGQALPPACLAA
jgi:hypothetical protein